MGQKTNPIANRLGIIRGWDSNWYGGKSFESKLVEDDKIRKYLHARLSKAGIAKIVIERTLKLVTVTIHTARPGIIIGKGGQEVDKLKEALKKITKKEIQINISEIKRPELHSVIMANNGIYGMTGGQTASTTPLQARTATHPGGCDEAPFDTCRLVLAAGAPRRACRRACGRSRRAAASPGRCGRGRCR